eukprot:scaffold470261_cov33-Prasinocladus_malaysianus.AAC.1
MMNNGRFRFALAGATARVAVHRWTAACAIVLVLTLIVPSQEETIKRYDRGEKRAEGVGLENALGCEK